MSGSPGGKGTPPKSGPDAPTMPDQTLVEAYREVGLAATVGTGNAGPAPAERSGVVASGPAVVITPTPGSSVASAVASGGALAVPSADLPAGTVVGEYRIEGKLGEGGMGQVFAATHPLIGKRAAIKVIKLELCANVEAVERFVQEARAVNQIGHPNIVDVFSFGGLLARAEVLQELPQARARR
jgi:hypothetical protein